MQNLKAGGPFDALIFNKDLTFNPLHFGFILSMVGDGWGHWVL